MSGQEKLLNQMMYAHREQRSPEINIDAVGALVGLAKLQGGSILRSDIIGQGRGRMMMISMDDLRSLVALGWVCERPKRIDITDEGLAVVRSLVDWVRGLIPDGKEPS